MRALIVLALVLAGCSETPDATSPPLADTVQVEFVDSMQFETHVITPAVFFGHGLYEPTIDMSPSGVLYVSAHTTGVDTTGAPAFFSSDDGATWEQLPFSASVQMPEPGHGATPPPSDEIFIVADDEGNAWGVDITLATFPVNGWCGDGAEHCYHHPNAFDRGDTVQTCSAGSLNDRPWAAVANGKLLMVNNPGGGPVQIGVMDVPPALPAEAAPAQWNTCASSGGFIPGIPDMRDDHFFAVPQMQAGTLVLVTGNAADIFTLKEVPVFSVRHSSVSSISNYGQATFDATGTMFVSAMANGEEGAFKLAVSTDGSNFSTRTFTFDRPVSSLYIDGSLDGAGAIVNWGLLGDEGTDWYVAHAHLGPDGAPVLENASLAVADGPAASRHVQGATVGPGGRAYTVLSHISGNDNQGELEHIGTTPMFVAVQTAGPTL